MREMEMSKTLIKLCLFSIWKKAYKTGICEAIKLNFS